MRSFGNATSCWTIPLLERCPALAYVIEQSLGFGVVAGSFGGQGDRPNPEQIVLTKVDDAFVDG